MIFPSVRRHIEYKEIRPTFHIRISDKSSVRPRPMGKMTIWFVGPQDGASAEVTCGELIVIQYYLNNIENDIKLGLATSGDLMYQLS